MIYKAKVTNYGLEENVVVPKYMESGVMEGVIPRQEKEQTSSDSATEKGKM